MEAEINRILDLLADGKIDAAEAERLIVALKQSAAPSSVGAAGGPRPAPEPIVRLDREARAAARRFAMWCHRVALAARCREQAHRRVRAELTVEERVRHILEEHLLVEPDAIAAEKTLDALVSDELQCTWGAGLGWDVLRLGIEDEFTQYWSTADLQGAGTLADLIAQIERRATPDAPTEPQDPQSEPQPTAPPKHRPHPKGGAKPAQPETDDTDSPPSAPAP